MAEEKPLGPEHEVEFPQVHRRGEHFRLRGEHGTHLREALCGVGGLGRWHNTGNVCKATRAQL